MEAYYLPLGRVLVKRRGKTHLRDKWPRPRKSDDLPKLLTYKKRLLKEVSGIGAGKNPSFDHLQFIHRRLGQVNVAVKSHLRKGRSVKAHTRRLK